MSCIFVICVIIISDLHSLGLHMQGFSLLFGLSVLSSFSGCIDPLSTFSTEVEGMHQDCRKEYGQSSDGPPVGPSSWGVCV